jgi:hypothetical protein
MSACVTWTCNGHRHGQPCRGALSVSTLNPGRARAAASKAGWRQKSPGYDLCPSRGHDEESDRP